MDEAQFLDLISGRTQSVTARLLRPVLAGLSLGYALVMRVRNALFDAGLRRPQRVGVPVVSVGNLTTGGTGKTPLVAFVVDWAQARQLRAGIISRGYRSLKPTVENDRPAGRRRSPETSGPQNSHEFRDEQNSHEFCYESDDNSSGNDEKRVLQLLCPGVPHVQNRDRIAAARELLDSVGADLLVADDAFQHRRLHRDLDIVLIDALNPFGYGHLLPRGLLRESRSSLRRADVVILTRANQVPESDRQAIWLEVRRWKPDVSEIEVAFVPQRLRDRDGRLTQDIAGPKLGFCGIGNPTAFRRTLDEMKVACVGCREFPDHHHYSVADLAELAKQARESGATALVTTLKDLVKMPATLIDGLPIWAVEIEAQVIRGADAFNAALRKVMPQASS